MVFTIYVEG
jgi:CRP-like cAMP-binding protein